MRNIFDSLKRQAFDIVTKTMGYDATWLSSESGSTILTASVGYKDPSEKERLSGIDTWNPDQPFMEYRVDFFTGLKARVDNGQLEHVTIVGVGYFSVKEVLTSVDGDTYVARLDPAIP